MDNWDFWNRGDAAQSQNPSDSNQDSNQDDFLRRQLLLRQFQQNLDNVQGDCSLYYPSEAAPDLNTLNQYQVQDVQNSQFDADRLSQLHSLHQYSQNRPSQQQQQQLSSMGLQSNEPIDVDVLDSAAPAAARPNLWETHQQGAQTNEGMSYLQSSSSSGTGRSLLDRQKREREETVLDPIANMPAHGFAGSDAAPAQKRIKPEDSGASLLSMILGQRQPSPLASREIATQDESRETYPPRIQLQASSSLIGSSADGAIGMRPTLETSTALGAQMASTLGAGNSATDNVQDIINGLFGDMTSRESLATFQSDANSNMSAVESGKAEPMKIGTGIFDDAEDDVDLSTTFQTGPTMSVATDTGATATKDSQPSAVGKSEKGGGVLSKVAGESLPDGNSTLAEATKDSVEKGTDGTFGDAADDPTIKAVEAATSGENKKAVTKSKPKKKPKQKPILSKPLAAQTAKEKNDAKSVLKGLVDLTSVLPENACMLLAKEFWIFTAQQFGHVFDTSSASYDTESMAALRAEIMDKVARSLVEDNDEMVEGRSSGNQRGIEPNAVEKLLLAPSRIRTAPKQPELMQEESLEGVGDDNRQEEDTKQDQHSVGLHDDIDVAMDVDSSRNDEQANSVATVSAAPADKSANDFNLAEVQSNAGAIVAEPRETSLVDAPSEAQTMDVDFGGSLDEPAQVSAQIAASTPQNDPNSSGCSADHSAPSAAVMETDMSVSGDKRAIADRIVTSWVDRLVRWKHDMLSMQTPAESLEGLASAFSLEGPFGLLLPEVLHNFLASISVSTAFEFLSVKFTEASMAMYALIVWRQLCGLEPVRADMLARHMGGLATRVKTALSSLPPADAYTRKWMGSALACLTAASKEFLIDVCKLETPQDFLNGRTSDFSNKLVAWREATKKSVLKGSGRVAMISSFKAVVRDSVVAENTKDGPGKVCTEDEIIELSKTLVPDESVDNSSVPSVEPKPVKSKPMKQKPNVTSTLTESERLKAEALLKSTEFLQKVLRAENVEFLARQNILTPEQFLSADKQSDSSLVQAMIKWRTETTGKQVLAASVRRLMSEWSTRVKEDVKRVATGVKEEDLGRMTKKPGPKPQARKPSARPTSPKRVRSRPTKNFGDPLEVLSGTALKFLKSIGITTGKGFLSARTSEMAGALAAWREEQKMAALKGTGCSATVSGWKASVRQAAESLIGDEEDLETFDTEPEPPKANKRPRRSLQPPKLKIDDVTHPYLLHGKPRQTLLVQNSNDPSCLYEFELSVRKPKNDYVMYLTYRGVREALSTGKSGRKKATRSDFHGTMEDPTCSFLPILDDASETRSRSRESTDTFVTSRRGCGLIDVGKYGAVPLPKEAQPSFLEMIEGFLCSGQSLKRSSSPPKQAQDGRVANNTSNVLVVESPEKGTQCLFYTAAPIEKGQTLQLCFSPHAQAPTEDESIAEPFVTIVDRLSLARKVSSLSLAEQKDAIEHLSKTLESIRSDTSSTETPQEGRQAITQPLLVRRRVHWLATQIVRILGESGGSDDVSSRLALVEGTKKLLMTDDDHRSLFLSSKQSGEELVLEELSQEILTDIVQNNSLGQWSHGSRWCDVSSKLWKKCLRKASAFLLGSFGGSASPQEMLKELDTCVFDAVKRIISWERDLSELAFKVRSDPNDDMPSRDFFLSNYERLPKGAVATASQEEAYENAMELCGDTAYVDLVKAAVRGGGPRETLVIASKVPWSQTSTMTRSTRDLEQENAQIDARWYIENQILTVAHAIASSDLLQAASQAKPDEGLPDYSYARFAGVARGILEADPTDDRRPSLEQPAASFSSSEMARYPLAASKHLDANTAVPSTLPLFLAVVWPRLKTAYGFSIEFGDDPADVTFFPPGHKGQYHRASERQVRLQRLERTKKRLKVQQQVNEVGFGDISKATKRMFISASRDDMSHEQGAPAKDALKQFVSSVLSEVSSSGDDEECRQRMTAIEDAISECFDELFPSMLPQEANDPANEATPESAHLMQVLLVLPSLLEQSGLSMRRIEDTLGVIRDLAEFLTFKNGELFAEPVQLCREEYEPGYENRRPFLLPRMQKFVSKPLATETANATDGNAVQNDDPELIREIINPEDMKELSGFIGTVLCQFLPCRATEYDLLKGRKQIHVGYPGMQCRHCAGAGKANEGRYFFTSLDSLNTAATGTLGHVFKCPHIPQELKTKIAALKTTHAKERQALKKGAQARFFSRLWKRLWSTNGIATPVVLANHKGIGAEEKGTATRAETTLPLLKKEPAPVSLEFKSHTDLLNYLTTTSPWSEKSDIRERIEQYYGCVAYGGDVYNTNAMPRNFTSEWLLSQLVNPECLSTKRTFLTG